MVKNINQGTRLKISCQLCHLKAVDFGQIPLISPNLNFLISKTESIIVSLSFPCRIFERITWDICKASNLGLAYNICLLNVTSCCYINLFIKKIWIWHCVRYAETEMKGSCLEGIYRLLEEKDESLWIAVQRVNLMVEAGTFMELPRAKLQILSHPAVGSGVPVYTMGP